MSNLKKFKNKATGYTIVDNEIIRANHLSLKSRMLLVIMLNLPDDWNFTEKGLSIAVGEGIRSIKSGLTELEKNGYLFRYQVKQKDGKYSNASYIVMGEPTVIDLSLLDEKVKVLTKEHPMLQNVLSAKTDVTFCDIGFGDIANGTQYNTLLNKDLININKNKEKSENSDKNYLIDSEEHSDVAAFLKSIGKL